MPVSTTATVTAGLPVFVSHAAGASIFVIPQRLPNSGSLGIWSRWYRWLGCAYRTPARCSKRAAAAVTDVPGSSRTRTRPLSESRSTILAWRSPTIRLRAEGVVARSKRTRSSSGTKFSALEGGEAVTAPGNPRTARTERTTPRPRIPNAIGRTASFFKPLPMLFLLRLARAELGALLLVLRDLAPRHLDRPPPEAHGPLLHDLLERAARRLSRRRGDGRRRNRRRRCWRRRRSDGSHRLVRVHPPARDLSLERGQDVGRSEQRRAELADTGRGVPREHQRRHARHVRRRHRRPRGSDVGAADPGARHLHTRRGDIDGAGTVVGEGRKRVGGIGGCDANEVRLRQVAGVDRRQVVVVADPVLTAVARGDYEERSRRVRDCGFQRRVVARAAEAGIDDARAVLRGIGEAVRDRFRGPAACRPQRANRQQVDLPVHADDAEPVAARADRAGDVRAVTVLVPRVVVA